MTLKIKPMDSSNYKDVAAIGKACLEEAWSEQVCLEQLSNKLDRTYVACSEGLPVGFLSVWNVAGEVEINNFAVLKEYRRQGIGKALMKKALADLNDVQLFYLEVRQSNSSAIALYNSFGFEVCGERKNFYKNPTENALIMKKSFTEK